MTTSKSFSRLASGTASTKRNPAASGNKVGVPVAHLSSISIAPIMPITPQIAEYYRISSPREVYVTYTQDTSDVVEGDVMTISGSDYRVSSAGPWPTDRSFIEILVQKVKGS